MFSPITACAHASIMVVALLLARSCLAKKVPPAVLVTCWWFVLARAMIPLFVLCQSREIVDLSGSSLQAIWQGNGATSTLFADFDVAAHTQGDSVSSVFVGAFLSMWTIIAVILSAVLIVTYVLDRRRLFKLSLDITGEFVDLCNDILSSQLHRRLRIVEVQGLSAPISYGVFRPVIALPVGFRLYVADAQLVLILRHELSHIRRFDTLLKPLAMLVVCAYWFNPLIWLAFFFMQSDMERAADEWALLGCNRKEKAMYARNLLKAKAATNPSNLACAFGASPIETRIKAILAPRPKLLACIVSSILVLTCCFASLAFANVAVPADSEQTTVTIRNGSYSFDIPAYWQGRVSVTTNGKSTYVYPTGYPELVLVSFSMLEDVDEGDVTRGCPIVTEIPCANGQILAVRVMNYLDMAAGDLWRAALAANPGYPGLEGEELAVDLSTFGEYSAQEAHQMEGVYGTDVGHPQVVNLMAEPLLSSVKVDERAIQN